MPSGVPSHEGTQGFRVSWLPLNPKHGGVLATRFCAWKNNISLPEGASLPVQVLDAEYY